MVPKFGRKAVRTSASAATPDTMVFDEVSVTIQKQQYYFAGSGF